MKRFPLVLIAIAAVSGTIGFLAGKPVGRNPDARIESESAGPRQAHESRGSRDAPARSRPAIEFPVLPADVLDEIEFDPVGDDGEVSRVAQKLLGLSDETCDQINALLLARAWEERALMLRMEENAVQKDPSVESGIDLASLLWETYMDPEAMSEIESDFCEKVAAQVGGDVMERLFSERPSEHPRNKLQYRHRVIYPYHKPDFFIRRSATILQPWKMVLRSQTTQHPLDSDEISDHLREVIERTKRNSGTSPVESR